MKHELIKSEDKKTDIINYIKENNINKAILFCNKKRDIESFVKFLEENGFKAFGLHNSIEEDVRAEYTKSFNRCKKAFLVCSDSVAKKINLTNVSFIIGTDLPTRANDYKTRLNNYMTEDGLGLTFYKEGEEYKITEINRVMNPSEKNEETEVKAQPKAKQEVKAQPKKPAQPKKQPAKEVKDTKESKTFGNNVPHFLQVDISHLLKEI